MLTQPHARRLLTPSCNLRKAPFGARPTAGDFVFGTLAIPLTLLCQCLSDETLKAVGPFYLVSMPGEVKDPTSPHWNV